MEAYSMDLRERVIEAYDAGRGSSRELAEEFDVTAGLGLVSCSGCVVKRVLWAAKEYRRGPRPRLNEQQLARLAKLVDQYPDATLADLRRGLRVDCSLVTIHRALKKLDVSYKKSRSAAASKDRPDVARQRRSWWRQVAGIARRRLIFLDESGAQTHTKRLYGRTIRGKRLVDAVPGGHWRNDDHDFRDTQWRSSNCDGHGRGDRRAGVSRFHRTLPDAGVETWRYRRDG